MADLHYLSALRQKSRRTPHRGIRRLHLESLEKRYALTGFCGSGDCLTIDLVADFDTFGNQIETVQAYGEGDDALVAFAIYDTGASVITWSANDQTLFRLLDPEEIGIPIKVPGGAGADAIGGGLNGDVSEPATIRADGLHAIDFSGGIDYSINLDENSGRAEGVQSFVGTPNGSGQLPTITGVPIHYPSPEHPGGVAAWIDMNAYEYDLYQMFPEFGELFEGLVLYAPDIFFVDSGQTLETSPDGDTTSPIRIPLELWGDDNHADPGDEITYVENPVQRNVFFADNGLEVANQSLLFDTGAQLSVISTEIALSLGLNLDVPQMTIDVQGAAGAAEIPGYFIDELQVPIDNDGDGNFDGGLQFTNVPIFVLDLVPGLDGILGMNLFNLSDVMYYDPFDPLGPSVQTRFFNELVREIVLPGDLDGDGEVTEVDAVLGSVADLFPTMAGAFPTQPHSLANLGLGNVVSDTVVVGRQLFYNGSALDGQNASANAADDNAIASGLAALRPGLGAAAQNVSGNVGGITGVMIDVVELADGSALSAADFEFRFGTSDDPSEWAAVVPQSISVRDGAGKSGSDRISLTFDGQQTSSGWLEVRIRASQATGLEYDDVFYFGNQPGDTDGNGQVDATDFTGVRANPRSFLDPAPAGNPFDVNHDTQVNAADMLMVRENITSLATQLRMISPPPADLGSGFTGTLRLAGSEPARRATIGPAAASAMLPPAEDTSNESKPTNPSAAPRAVIEIATPVQADSLDLVMAAYAQQNAEEDAPLELSMESVEAEELDVCFAVE